MNSNPGHASALLVPDGRVLSMGRSHHRGAVTDPNAPRPIISFGGPGDLAIEGKPLLAYGGVLNASVTGATPSRFTLIRLGAATHGFDQDQRFVELSFE